MRIEVRRGKAINRGDEAVGHELFIKVVKNKQAPPFRSAHCSLVYGKGIPLTMSIVDMAIDANVLKRKGSWLTYKGETLAQGKDRLTEFLDKNPELLAEIRQTVLDEAAAGLGFYTAPESESDDGAGEENDSGVDLDSEVIELDISDDAMKDDVPSEKK